MNLLLEAILCGLAFLLLGLLVTWGYKAIVDPQIPPILASLDGKYNTEIIFFLTGFVGHLLFVWSGTSDWYCRNKASSKLEDLLKW